MSYFNDTDWNKLIYDISMSIKSYKEVKHANKGRLFEFVVEQLLAYLFHDIDIKFSSTKMSYDGSKDFWGIDDEDQLWWAECKNYTNNISLTQLAPTLFMADLREASNIIFFSHSRLNINLKRKIGLYANKHNKEIFIYEDECLDDLILRVFPEESQRHISYPEKSNKPIADSIVVQHFNERNPLFFSRGSFSEYYEIKELRMNEIYNINAIVLNNDLDREYDLLCSIEVDEMLYSFQVLSTELESTVQALKMKKTIKPCQIILFTFSVRLIKPGMDIRLPLLTIEIMDGMNSIIHSNKEGSKYYGYTIDTTGVIIGSHYEKLLASIEKDCLDKSKLAGGLLYGASGTGKTRVLKECYAMLVRNGYNVLNFIGFDVNNDWKNVLKEIIYNVFSIHDDVVLDLLCESLSDEETTRELTIEQKRIIELLKILNKQEMSFDSIKGHLKIVFEKMRHQRIGMIVDNIQSYSSDITFLFKEMTAHFLSSPRSTDLCVFYSLNTENIFDSVFTSFLGTYLSYENDPLIDTIICRRIEGFRNPEQAVLFLQTKLKIRALPIDALRLKTLVSKVSLRPKHLDLIVNYLINNGAVEVKSDYGIISNQHEFAQVLESMPENMQVLFEQSYQAVKNHYIEYDEADFLTAVSFVFLLGIVTNATIETYNLNINLFRVLNKHGFFSRDDSGKVEKYAFEHDLIEKYFKYHYPNLIDIAAQKIDQEKRLTTLKGQYKWAYQLMLLSLNRVDKYEVFHIVAKNSVELVPNRLQYDFLIALLKNTIRLRKSISREKFISISCTCCKFVRDHISERLAADMFDMIFSYISSDTDYSKTETKELFSFIINMAENRIRLRDTKKAQELYLYFLDQIKPLYRRYPKAVRELDYSKSYIYNREFVCNRIDSTLSRPGIKWKESHISALKNEFHDILFENYCDLASFLRSKPHSQRKIIIVLRKAFCEYELMTEYQQRKFWVNYHSNKIRFLCLESKFDSALALTEESLIQLDYNREVNYHLFFRSRYLQYKILLHLLLKKDLEKFDYMLEDYRLTQELLGRNYTFELTYYQVKYYWIANDFDSFNHGFEMLISMLSTFKPSAYQISVLMENLAIEYRIMGGNRKKHSCPLQVFSKCRDILIMSKDELELFLSRYQCDAPLVDKNGIDGYFFL